MVHIATVLIILVTAFSITDHLLGNIWLEAIFNSTIAMDKYHNMVFHEEIFKSYGVNHDEPKSKDWLGNRPIFKVLLFIKARFYVPKHNTFWCIVIHCNRIPTYS